MFQFGLVGFPLSHSRSPEIFESLFKHHNLPGATYDLFELEDLSRLKPLLDTTPSLSGFNVTIPYKQSIIPCLDSLDEAARRIGAVNCVKIRRDHGGMTLEGYNTDYPAFRKTLEKLPIQDVKRALILGTGGSSRAVGVALEYLGIEYATVSREKARGDHTYDEIDEPLVAAHRLIINTTPLGMYPKVDGCPPFPFQYLTRYHVCYDLIYNPEKTQFLAKAEKMGTKIKNGEEMLKIQAEESWEIWSTEWRG